ncbi:hypothetical protein BGX20_011243, partial [Mortierella sp. AD010]
RTGEDIKELQSILDDDSLSIKKRQYVKIAMKKFQKLENRGIVEGANVVGATCIASTFEVLDDVTFPIVILDEVRYPMSLIPICRAAAEKLVMVGDPLQLPPPLSTNDDSPNSCKGLSRTLFDRSTEMGFKPIMLRTQYRCHSRIAGISNALFYSNVLRTGISSEDRAPLIENLPTLSFIDNIGQEIQNTKTKSYTNPAEIRLIVTFIQRLLNLNIPEASIGVISLCEWKLSSPSLISRLVLQYLTKFKFADKSQADGIQAELSEQLKNSGLKGSVQISTVDAFQVSSTDGLMNADQFVQLLRTLKPLPKQAMSDQAQLLVSEDEEDDHIEQEDEGQDTYYHQDEEDLEYDEDGYIHEHITSEPTTLAVSSRKYALYETDDDDSDDAYDRRGERYDVKQPAGQQQRHRSQSYYREDQHPKPIHNSSAEYNMSQDSDLKPRPDVVKSAITGTTYQNVVNTATSFHSGPSDSVTNSRKNMTSQGQFTHERNDSFAQTQTLDSGSRELGYHSSLEGISQLEDTFDGILETEIQSEVLFSKERDMVPIKEEKQGRTVEGEEEVEKVIWEMGDEPEEPEEERPYSDVGVTPGGNANTEELSSKQQQWQHQQDLSLGDVVHSEHASKPHSIDSFSRQGSQVQNMATYESQRIEDLEVAGWSQLVASDERVVMVETPTRNVESRALHCHALVGGDIDEEDDMSCLEVEDLDMM